MHQQLPFKRTDRVGQQIKSILGDIALKYISLKHLGFVTFTSVDVSSMHIINLVAPPEEISLHFKQPDITVVVSPKEHNVASACIYFAVFA